MTRPYTPAKIGPAEGILACTMDAKRSQQFVLAVRSCIMAFLSEQHRPPRVLDMGSGSGLLSVVALQTGAGFVVAVDCNADMLSLTRATLERAGFVHGVHFDTQLSIQSEDDIERVRVTEGSGVSVPVGVFDVVVSDILGDNVWSYSAPHVLKKVRPLLRRFDGPHNTYAVPQSFAQYASVVRFPSIFKQNDLRERVFDTTVPPSCKGSRVLQLFASRETPIPFHILPRETIVPATEVASYHFGCDDQPWLDSKKTLLPAWTVAATDAFLALEWTANLWHDHILCNTFDAYTHLSPVDAHIRAHGWGLTLARIADLSGAPKAIEWHTTRNGGVHVSISKQWVQPFNILSV